MFNDLDKERKYEEICKSYVYSTTNDVLLKDKNDKILHFYIDDKFIPLRAENKINLSNYKKYLDGNSTVYKYDTYKDLYNSSIGDSIREDIDDLGLYDKNNNYNFYIPKTDLKFLVEEMVKYDVNEISKDTSYLEDKYKEFTDEIDPGTKKTFKEWKDAFLDGLQASMIYNEEKRLFEKPEIENSFDEEER